MHYHFVGIGGIGLSAIARVLLEQGHRISGSDLELSPVALALAKAGAVVHEGHDAAHLQDPDVVIVSSAVPLNNHEIVAARQRGIPVIKRDQLLGRMMDGKIGVAVAGTHGKTTTSSLIAHLLMELVQDPTFIIGGVLGNLGTNARAGAGPHFVIEADEYDRAFLGLKPHIAVVTHLEHDHPDCFPTVEDVETAFRQFLALTPPDGCVIGCADAPRVLKLLRELQAQDSVTVQGAFKKTDNWAGIGRLGDENERKNLPTPSSRPRVLRFDVPAEGLQDSEPEVLSYGLSAAADWQAVDLAVNDVGGYDFTALQGGVAAGRFRLGIPGLHNVRNALAALIVIQRLGLDLSRAAGALAEFRPTARRFELKGEAGGVTVIDDYAHHPTEIRATLAAAREQFPERVIWAVFQPHTYSRTQALMDDFAASFADADRVIVLDIYPARESAADFPGITAAALLARMAHPAARCTGAQAEALTFLLQELRPGDVLITLGAGDGYLIGEKVLERLK